MLQEEKVCLALAEQFKAIGVDVSVEFQATGPFVDKCDNGKCDFFVQGAIIFRYRDDGWRTTRPQLAAWFEGFSERPAMARTAPVEIW